MKVKQQSDRRNMKKQTAGRLEQYGRITSCQTFKKKHQQQAHMTNIKNQRRVGMNKYGKSTTDRQGTDESSTSCI